MNTAYSAAALLPPDWKNDVKMATMFADLPAKRDLNPAEWDSRIKFWTPLVMQYLQQRAANTTELLFSVEDLEVAFARNGKSPKCLARLIGVLQAEGKVRAPQDIAHGGQARRSMLGSLVTSLFSYVSGGGAAVISPVARDAVLVCPSAVEERARHVRSLLQQSVDGSTASLMFTSEEVSAQAIKGSGVASVQQQASLQLLLDYMERQGMLKALPVKRGRMFKLLPADQAAATVDDTQSDVAIAGLKHAQQTLQRQIRDAEQTIVRKMEEVRGYVRKNAKNIAVIHLKQVKQLEKQLQQRSDMLSNLDTLMMHIDSALADKMILDSMTAGSKALKDMRTKYNITAESAEEVMAELSEVIEDSEEISQVLTQPVNAMDGVLQQEAEDEWEQLLQQVDHEEKRDGVTISSAQQPHTPIGHKTHVYAATPGPVKQPVSAVQVLNTPLRVPVTASVGGAAHRSSASDELTEQLARIHVASPGSTSVPAGSAARSVEDEELQRDFDRLAADQIQSAASPTAARAVVNPRVLEFA